MIDNRCSEMLKPGWKSFFETYPVNDTHTHTHTYTHTHPEKLAMQIQVNFKVSSLSLIENKQNKPTVFAVARQRCEHAKKLPPV